MNNPSAVPPLSILNIPHDAIQQAVDLYHSQQQALPKHNILKHLDLNNFEKRYATQTMKRLVMVCHRLASSVITPAAIDVGFNDIGALDTVKQTLREIVMLPLRRPDLFQRGQLKRAVTGVLLFGPPGTGKTMLAKAIAGESGAAFISMDTFCMQCAE